nr:hypothetical protein [Nanoarchaeum sp.]
MLHHIIIKKIMEENKMKTNKIATIAAAGLLALTVGCSNNSRSLEDIQPDQYQGRNHTIHVEGQNFYAETDANNNVVKFDLHDNNMGGFSNGYVSKDAPIRCGQADSVSTYTLSDSAQIYINQILRLTDRLEYHLVRDRLEQTRRHDINN